MSNGTIIDGRNLDDRVFYHDDEDHKTKYEVYPHERGNGWYTVRLRRPGQKKFIDVYEGEDFDIAAWLYAESEKAGSYWSRGYAKRQLEAVL